MEPVGSSPSAPGNLPSVANLGFVSAFIAAHLLGKDSQGSPKRFVPPEQQAQGRVGRNAWSAISLRAGLGRGGIESDINGPRRIF